VAGGERSDVEFKSTARFNLHTGKRDERIELVVGKTVAALANTDGGHLLIGVADDGTVLGLDDDLGLMKKPDVDRFELWLRDYLTQTLGGAAATSAVVRFPSIDGREICWVAIPPSTRPVYLVPGKSQPPQLWVRVGNSTRQLPLDEALAYASDRWGRRRLRSARN
jgi:predicted HTH transcriptional regulator